MAVPRHSRAAGPRSMSQDTPASQGSSLPSAQRNACRVPQRGRQWFRLILSVLAAYVLAVFMLHLLQRSLIYFPTREARIEPGDAGFPPGQVHTITVSALDQMELRGWHVLPAGHIAASRRDCDRELAAGGRLVLYFSGNGGNRRYRTAEVGILARLGLHVFVVDYRGYGDTPGSPSEELLSSDARAVWTYATRVRRVQPGRVILYGESLGGAVAVRLAAELCEADNAPAGLILRSTFSSLVDAGAHHYPWLPVRLALVDRYPAIEFIPRVTCPILQIHGARDTIMPILLGQRLFAKAPAHSSAGIRKTFIEVPRAAHNDMTLVAEQELRAAIREFLSSLDRAQ